MTRNRSKQSLTMVEIQNEPQTKRQKVYKSNVSRQKSGSKISEGGVKAKVLEKQVELSKNNNSSVLQPIVGSTKSLIESKG